MVACECSEVHHARRVVLTGGPGAGKTAVLEMVRQSLCHHVRVLPEAASIVFGGGFPRHAHDSCRRVAQGAIYHIQTALEATGEAHNPAIMLCDRGTLDGLAYWPGPVESFWDTTGTTPAAELARYDAVLHLRTPAAEQGYNQQNPLRTETATIAGEIDDRILQAWNQHPRRYVFEAAGDFLDKAARVLQVLRVELPRCCERHLQPDAQKAWMDHG